MRCFLRKIVDFAFMFEGIANVNMPNNPDRLMVQ
jgi:hypothetical protein